MEIWLDTVNPESIANAVKTGVIAGITTNPSILAKAKDVQESLLSLLSIQKGPIAVQVVAQDSEEMIAEGRHIFDFSDRMIVKVPVNRHGLVAIHQLCKNGIPVLATGIVHPTQALLAANHGAAYIAPYYSHIDDIGNAQETLKTIVTMMRANSYQTKVLVASLRNLNDLIYCSLLGVDAVTIKDDLYEKLVADHHLMERFSQKFLSDWRHAHGNVSIKDLLTKS